MKQKSVFNWVWLVSTGLMVLASFAVGFPPHRLMVRSS